MANNFMNNVLDVVDAWRGYPLQNENGCFNPFSNANDGDASGYGRAINSGKVEVKCFINNICPFYKTPFKEDSIIFNSMTYKELVGDMDNKISNTLQTTPLMEGIHFIPRMVFRHNYIYQYVQPETLSVSGLTAPKYPSYEFMLDYFDDYFQDISYDNKAPTVTGSDQTRYKKEQSWVIMPSVFFANQCDFSAVQECNINAIWTYFDETEGESQISLIDISYDYNKEYYEAWKDSFDSDGNLKEKVNRIKPYNIQMPMQTNVHNIDNYEGVHWRLDKRTPLFQGEDFFIRFYKQASESVVNVNQRAPKRFTDTDYAPLDALLEDSLAQLNILGSNHEVYINNAVRGATGETEEETITNMKVYELYTQAYYVIELGKGTSDTNYFIVITERGYPMFVHFARDQANKKYSKKFGEVFEGVSGKTLISAKGFDIIVRNHLGKLVIQFKGPFAEVAPWIIDRSDLVVEDDNSREQEDKVKPVLTEKVGKLIVPRGRMSLWGGNLKSSFIFGPLQYQAGHTSFVYPPRPLNDSDDPQFRESSYSAFQDDRPKKVSLSSNYFKSDPLWLPINSSYSAVEAAGAGVLGSNHDIKFHAYDYPFMGEAAIGDKDPPFKHEKLFTQDAQFYNNYIESDGNSRNKNTNLGAFYYDYPIKDFSQISENDLSGVRAKMSYITVRKYRYMNHEKSRHQGFDTLIGMICGDHIFTGQTARESLEHPLVPEFEGMNLNEVQYDKLSDDEWFLRNCKTPIMTSFRLISYATDEPRWNDGTTISSGMNRIPNTEDMSGDNSFNTLDSTDGYEGTSGYFVDASDHVLSFNHSWTSANLSELEHSGTIQFYLNSDMDVPNNVTHNLIALQNKAFYIELWAGYENCNFTQVPGFYKMFTGICQGGKISYEYGKHIMTCNVEDYSVILKSTVFFNSPWFDGLKDIMAINKIVGMGGFRDQGPYDPGGALNAMSNMAGQGTQRIKWNHFDGRYFLSEVYALPSGYSRLEQPAFKFNEGDTLMDAISKISKISAKLFYFDEFGIAHYEDYRDRIERDFLNLEQLEPLYEFTINPEEVGGQLIFNRAEREYDVASVHNHLKTLSNTPDGHLLIRDHYDKTTIENPEEQGFLGFPRTFYQVESMFGSKEAQISAMNKYSVAFKPIVLITFETYGLPLRATDIVKVHGEILRVTKVDHSFDPAKNVWWMQVECKRFQPIDESKLIVPD
jgi:hypothetical protein